MLPALILHNHIQIGACFLQTSASASGHHHIHKLNIYLILVKLGLQICPYRLLYIVLCLSVDSVK